MLFASVCLALACVASYASQPKPNLNARSSARDSARIQAARQEALASRSGKVASESTMTTSSGWTSRHTLYVGCTNSPAGSTFSGPTGIQQALAVVVPYSTIKVCAGMYSGGNILRTSYVAIVGQGPSGAVTVACGTTPNPVPPTPNGFDLDGSYDSLKNVTVNDCYVGAYINNTNSGQELRNDQVLDSNFSSDYYAIEAYDDAYSVIEGNVVSSSFYGIYADYPVSDRIIANDVVGDGLGKDSGIVVDQGVSVVVKSNQVTGSIEGLYLDLGDSFLDVENNHFNNNEDGVYLSLDNNGNEFERNTADGNTHDGFFVGPASGADASSGQLPNRFLYNNAFGNGNLDYEDLTLGYTGGVSGTDHGTANYYHANNGNTASPMGIVTHTN